MNKQRKIILKIWIIFISVIFIILLFLLGLRLPKLFKEIKNQSQLENKVQCQYQTQYIYDTNKVKDIIELSTKLKELKNKQQYQEQEKTQPINNLNFFNSDVQNELYHKLSKELDKIIIPKEHQYETQSSIVPSEQLNDDNQLIKNIAVVTLTIGATIISSLVLTPIFASLGPLAAPSLGPLASSVALLV